MFFLFSRTSTAFKSYQILRFTLLIIATAIPSQAFLYEANIEVYYDFNSGKGTFESSEAVELSLAVKNKESYTLKGFLAGSVSDLEGNVVQYFEKYVEVSRGHTQLSKIPIQLKKPGVYKVYARFRNSRGVLGSFSCRIAYALNELKSPQNLPEDFNMFWQNTLRELAKIPPRFEMIHKPSLSNERYKVYLIRMRSLDNMLIQAWYRVPKGKYGLTAILQIPSLGGSFFNVRSLREKPRHGVPYDMAVLSLNIRGHGNSQSEIDPGENYAQLIARGIEQKEKYFYRGALMDCIRALDFLAKRPEIDQDKIVVEGASQGGALSLLTAALDDRVDLCAPDVPFLSDIPQLMRSCPWVRHEFERYRMNTSGLTQWRQEYNLRYFDTKNFCDRIKVPVLLGLGLQDPICPIETSMVSYNYIRSSKNCYIYPEGKHEGGGANHRKRKFAWIRWHFSS